MNWVCGNRSFEIYKIDTDNTQKSLMEIYCEDSHFLSKLYKVTKNSKFSAIDRWKVSRKFYKNKKVKNNLR